jgi:glucose-1-phosphate adenylyltransferase
MFKNSGSPPNVDANPDATTVDLGSPQQLMRQTAAVVLAGGKGTRLGALTRRECKPALPFGGRYRNIDFSLSNCVNSGIHRIGVATQYKDASLLRHMAEVWRDPGSGHGDGFVVPWRAGSSGYSGTADAVFKNWARIEVLDARWVLVLAGDHVYKMDYLPMFERHIASGADVTVGCVEVPVGQASQFGVASIDHADRIVRFQEKPCQPEPLPGRPDRVLASMGIYLFDREFLGRLLKQDAFAQTSGHDFGRDLIPRLISKADVFAYPYTDDAAVGGGYWRDVGTVPAYWRAHMELLDGVAGFGLDDANWPVRSADGPLEDKRFRARAFGQSDHIVNSLLADGCEVDQASVHRSVLCSNVTVAPHARLSNAVVLPNAVIGRDCCLVDVIVDAGVRVPEGTVIGPASHDDGETMPFLITADIKFAGRAVERKRYSRWQHSSHELLQRTGT